MARQKKLKPVDSYLNPKPKTAATAVAAGLAQMEKRGLQVRVKRIASSAGPQQGKA
jgi:hypothetical protein